MVGGHDDPRTSEASDAASETPVSYPVHHVLGVVDTGEQAAQAVEALTDGGFLESEVQVATGARSADRVHASTGRTGLANLAIRIAEHLGIADDEMETKARYEQALRDGHFVVNVATATAERKDLAAQILREHGAHTVNYMGRFTRQEIFR